ncbi:MAG: hypothetical protein NTZ05_16960, partial [Chloroflexi bacterium]|nr:hypothetical protein [Chloroflexota bacterium]
LITEQLPGAAAHRIAALQFHHLLASGGLEDLGGAGLEPPFGRPSGLAWRHNSCISPISGWRPWPSIRASTQRTSPGAIACAASIW